MDKLVNEMKSNGDDIKEGDVVEKTICTISNRFDYVVTAIEEGKDVTTMTLNDFNHLSGNNELFSNLDESFRSIVKLGDNSKLQVLGKEKIAIRLKDGSLNYIYDVFYVPNTCYILLNIGQLAEKGYDLNFNKRGYTVNDTEMSLIANTSMSRNRLFPMNIEYGANMCCKTIVIEDNWLWHMCLGHFNFESIKFLANKKWVTGLPVIQVPNQLCEACVVGKKHRYPFPKGSAWRATKPLELVHSDLCYVEVLSNRVTCTVYLLNRCSVKSIRDKTPQDAWSGQKPNLSNLKVFGCIAYAHVPDQLKKKLDDKAEKCKFLGYNEETKTYKLYNPETQKVVISKDVAFDEDGSLDWSEKKKELLHVPVTINEEVDDKVNEPSTVPTFDELSTEPTQDSPPRRYPQRERHPPPHLKDYEVGQYHDLDNMEEEITYYALFADCDHVTHEEAANKDCWMKAMDEEIHAIEKNNTWELTILPEGKKPIGVKWVYKTKYNPKGEVNRFKARLVAKGYKQKPDIDYFEVLLQLLEWTRYA
ncbi:uncharacterized protein LOC127096440 [Lathyrus oleraceus]|uniref:uncharacterized protein LOC127096440 n=1 Tax=Pisum sativum TaxID=3888 RepID=UPI0021D1DD6F|nr:uncharacterized protein LOC127096440 [Pisum sativum]